MWFWLLPCFLSAQQKLDSLRGVVRSGPPMARFNALNALSDHYSDNNLSLSMHYAKASLVAARAVKSDSCTALAYNSIANVYQYQTALDSALRYHQKALRIRMRLKDSAGMADSHNNIGIAYDQQARFPEALRHYFHALSYFDKKRLVARQAMTYTNIGIVYKAQKQWAKALEYYQKAHAAYAKTNDGFGQTVSAGNLGSILIPFGRYGESLRYSQRALEGYRKIDGGRFTGYPIANMAIVYDSLRQFGRANAHYTRAIALHEQHHNDFEVAESGNAYAASLIRQKKYAQAIAASQKALAFAQKSDAPLNVAVACQNLSTAHAMLGQYPEAYRFATLYNQGRDRIFQIEKTQAIADMATRYETRKKEAEIRAQKANVRRQQFVLLVVSLLAVFAVVIIWLLWRQQKLKNAQLRHEHELKTAIAQIETQSRLQQQRLEISRDLHDNIGAQLTFIISSVENIRHAFEISHPKLDGKLGEISHFAQSTIRELRDTIWAMNSQEILFDDLKARILNFVEKAQSATGQIEFQFAIDPTLASVKLSSVAGMNIYRTIQEAVNNAVKHARAQRLLIWAHRSDSDIELVIEDDGDGFDIVNAPRSNGLANMEKRISEIGGTFLLRSDLGKGTKISILLHQKDLV